MGEKLIRTNDEVAGFIDPEHPQRKYYKCRYCGNPFWKPDAFRMKYCSTDCQRSAYKEEHPKKIKPRKISTMKNCEWCGKKYETTKVNQKYCCKECGYEGNKRLQRKQWAEAFVSKKIVCKECNTEFMTECGNPRSVFCCQSCADKYERRVEHSSQRHKDYMKGCKRKREKQIAEQKLEEVSYEFIFKRDKGVCGICGLPVHEDKFVDSNWGGTIDHIVPLSVGGYHSNRNCQLAHRICNSLKCKETEEYSINWEEKSKENNYWRIKYENYRNLMGA